MVLILPPPNKSRKPRPKPTGRGVMLGVLFFALAAVAAGLIYNLR
jgi:hypothetical protein